MDASVAGSVCATIKVVLQNLLSSPLEEISLWNFNEDLQKLKESVAVIQDFLEHAEMRQDEEKVRSWLTKLEDVAFDADYVFDKLNYKVLRMKVKTDHKMMKKVSSFFPAFNLAFGRKMAREIKDINSKLKSIIQVALALDLEMRSAHGRRAGTDRLTYLETDSLSVDPVCVGRADDCAKIVEMLTTAPTQQLLSVLPIVGMGGLGKTTLTKIVYNDANIIYHFGKRIWVRVSENDFDPMTVLKSVVASLTGENVDGGNEVALQKLQKSLGDKKYLLVLDDVWDENYKWGEFVSSLEGISSVNGNVIMVTTRMRSVAAFMQTLGIYELRGLSDEDCWLIIRAKAFQGEGIPSELEIILKNIAKRCGGVPLAAQVVGSLLWGKSKYEWVSIEKILLQGIDLYENILLKLLKLSFDNLSSPLKKCFAFCSMVPKGWLMEKNVIIQLWMAEGLLQTYEEEDMEIVGNRMFNLLVQSSLLQVWEEDYYGNAEIFGMHDVVHDFASNIFEPKSLGDMNQVRYISRAHIDDSSPISTELAQFLRAVIFNGKIPQNILSNFKRLHALIIIDEDSNMLPTEIGKLRCLRYLDISRTRIEYLPESIGHLYHLQTLRSTNESGRSYLRKLPDTLKFLICLRHLYIPNIKLPPKVGDLIFLQTLPYFQVGDEEGCGIMELGSLKNLKGAIEIHNLEKVRDGEQAKNANLVHKPNIVRLKLVWNESREDESNDENVLDGLQPHWNLKSLEITGFKGKSFPQWTLRMEVREILEDRWIRLDNLLEIQLSYCTECEVIPTMGHLPHLKSLYLSHLSNVNSMGSSFYGVTENEVYKETTTVFPALEKLELIDITNLFTWTEVELSSSSGTQSHEVLVFGRLQYLKITNCRQLASAPSHFPCLKELEIYNMESGLPLASICGSKLTTLKKLKICEVDGLVCLPDGLFNNNPDLLELDISDCNNLMHLVPCLGGDGASLEKLGTVNFHEDIHRLKALKELRILNCPNLKSISYPSGEQLESTVAATPVEELGSEQISSSKIMPGTDILREEFPDMLDMGISKISQADSNCSSISLISFDSEQRVESEFRGEKIVDEASSVPDAGFPGEQQQFTDEVAEKGIVPEDSQANMSMQISLISFDSEQRVESEFRGEKIVDEASSVPDAGFPGEQQGPPKAETSKHYQECSLAPCLFEEKGHYMIGEENNHLQLKLDNEILSISIGDYPSPAPPHNFPVNAMLNFVEQDLRELLERPNSSKLLLLFLQRNRRLTVIHPSFFDSMPDLHFLDISDTKISTLPSSLFKLSKLKVLMLRNCICLENLTPEIGNLYNLEALDLSGTELYNLPDEIGELTLLRSLQLSLYGPDDESEYDHLPTQLVSPSFSSKLKEIRSLSISVHPEDYRWAKIVSGILKDISKLEMLSYLQFYSPEVEAFEDFIRTSPSWKNQEVSKFDFIVGQNVKRVVSRVPDEVESLFNQQERCLRYVNGDKASPLIKTVLNRATAFYLDHHTEVQSLSEFNNSSLQALKFCVVRECPKIKAILDGKNAGSEFPCLEHLEIYFLWELKHIWKLPSPTGRLTSGNSAALRSLIISTCPKLQFVFWESMLQSLINLKELVVEDCECMERIIREENEKVKYEDNVLPGLRRLVLHYLPMLVSVGNGVRLSEENISIHGCPKLIRQSQP